MAAPGPLYVVPLLLLARRASQARHVLLERRGCSTFVGSLLSPGPRLRGGLKGYATARAVESGPVHGFHVVFFEHTAFMS